MEYFAQIKKSDGSHVVSFPDFPNVNTYGENLEDALDNAKEALNAALESDFERGYSLPSAQSHARKKGFHPVELLPHVALAYQLKRLRNGQSQVEIAKKIGISYQAYQKLENPRKCNPTVKTLERLAETLEKQLIVGFKNVAATRTRVKFPLIKSKRRKKLDIPDDVVSRMDTAEDLARHRALLRK